MSILSNELVRRLSTIHRDVLDEELEIVIEKYITQLKKSGYSRSQAKETIVCGVVGWRRKLERRENNNQKQYLEAKDTLEKRTRDKLLEKTRLKTWQASSATSHQQRREGRRPRLRDPRAK